MAKVFMERCSEHAILPTRATEYSAGLDLHADILDRELKGFDAFNHPIAVKPIRGRFVIQPGQRVLVPLGFKMQCPPDYCIKLFPRSGTAYKHGIILANSTGIVDADFPNECMAILHNTSKAEHFITHGDRIAQMTIEKVEDFTVAEVGKLGAMKSSRTGGFGHTGA